MSTIRALSGALASRAVLRVAGADAANALQGAVTNDVSSLLASGVPSAYAAVLTPKGKIFIDVFLAKTNATRDGTNEGFLLDVDRSRVDETASALKRLSLRKDVDISRVDDEYEVVVEFPGSENARKIGNDPRFEGLGRRGFAVRDAASTFVDAAHRELRYAHGIGEGVSELADAYPLECNFDALNGVSFTKGCYMGQENTARQYFRGVVRKRVVPFAFSGASVGVGAQVADARGDIVGDVIAVERDRGLMRARVKCIREAVAPNAAPLRCDDAEVVVSVPSWWPKKYLDEVD